MLQDARFLQLLKELSAALMARILGVFIAYVSVASQCSAEKSECISTKSLFVVNYLGCVKSPFCRETVVPGPGAPYLAVRELHPS